MRCTRGERRFLRALVFLDFALFEVEDFDADVFDLGAVELFLVVEDPWDDDAGCAGAESDSDWWATAVGSASAATNPAIRMTKSVKGRENNCKLTIYKLNLQTSNDLVAEILAHDRNIVFRQAAY